MKDFLPFVRLPLALFLLAAAAPNSRANVFASDIKLNGSSAGATTALGNPVAVSYLLNEDATAGATLNVLSNGLSIRAISVPVSTLATNGAGLSRGLNTVMWDGRDASGNFTGAGNFAFSVTPAAAGHANWTLLTTNSINTNISSGGYYSFAPRGIAVDFNTNSAQYGRVFIANAATGPNPNNVGDQDAILKFNADGSAAEDGAYGNGGYPMQSASFNLPQKLRMGADDRLYMNDLYNGDIIAFDPAIGGNASVLVVLNYFANPFFQDPAYFNGLGWFAFDAIASPTTNGPTGQIWMADYGTGGSGVWSWRMDNGVVDSTNNIGTWAVAAGAGCSLSIDATGGFMVATNSQVFASQFVDGPADTNYRCMMFTNATGFEGTNAIPISNAVWAVGSGDNTFRDVFDTTINARVNPQFVACSMSGPNSSGLRLLNAANGATAAANLDSANTYYATAWDAVGNLYAASGSLHGWREWSPPGGANSSTTVGHAVLKATTQSFILGLTVTNNQVVIQFTAPATNAPSNFSLLSSGNVASGYAVNHSAVFKAAATLGIFTATVPAGSSPQFYFIKQ